MLVFLWHISLSVLASRPIHIFENDNIYFNGWVIVQCVCVCVCVYTYHIFFVYLFIDDHLGSLYILANDAVKLDVYMSFQIIVFTRFG